MNTRDLIQELYFKGIAPLDMYEAILSSEIHSAFTNSEAKIDPKVGGEFTCYAGYIRGKNIFLEEGLMIIQEWQGAEEDWPSYHFSTVQFKFKSLDGGTHLTFIHKGIPANYYESISNGWYEHYWEPMKLYFANKT